MHNLANDHFAQLYTILQCANDPPPIRYRTEMGETRFPLCDPVPFFVARQDTSSRQKNTDFNNYRLY